MSQITIIQGHPDTDTHRFCRSLATAYAKGATKVGHSVHIVDVAQLRFPWLTSRDDWMTGRAGTPETLRDAQFHCEAANHIVLIYPLWLGTMPALLKAFLEQTFRPGVVLDDSGRFPRPLFRHKSAHVIVTMGMPAAAYRWFYRAHSIKSLRRNVLRFVGIKPVRETLIGGMDSLSEQKVGHWLGKMQALGAAAK